MALPLLGAVEAGLRAEAGEMGEPTATQGKTTRVNTNTLNSHTLTVHAVAYSMYEYQ